MNFRVEIQQEEDGRWIAEVVDLPGVLAYESTSKEAQARVQALALGVVADRLEHCEAVSVSPLRPHEPVVEHASPPCVGRASLYWMDRQANPGVLGYVSQTRPAIHSVVFVDPF